MVMFTEFLLAVEKYSSKRSTLISSLASFTLVLKFLNSTEEVDLLNRNSDVRLVTVAT